MNIRPSLLSLSNHIARRARVLSPLFGGVVGQCCVLCGAASGALALCVACADELPQTGARCPCCAEIVADGGLCARCLHDPPAFARTFCLFDYRPPVDFLVQSVKYRGDLAVAQSLGRLLAAVAPEDADVLIPVPLHPRRLQSRGYNQALELARPVAEQHGLRLLAEAVARTRATADQIGRTRQERQENLRGAFACQVDLRGQRVLLVDDVMTSGSTLRVLANCVRRGGAVRVDCLVVARTPP